MKDLSGIRKRLKERREELGYSYQTLADLTNMSKSTLQRYETGSIGNLPLDKLETLARALHCTPSYLMGWDEEDDASFDYVVYYGKAEELTEEEKQELQDFVQFLLEKRKRKDKGK